MKLGLLITASAVMCLSAAATASAGPLPFTVEWGEPDFPNYLSAPGPADCDWTYNAYFRACPSGPATADAAAPAAAPAKAVPVKHAKVKRKHKKS